MAQNVSVEAILNRLAALELAVAPQPVPDYSDPPLFFTKADGSAVNPDSFEKIPDLVKDLPVFSGDPSELNSWISDVDSLVKLYQTTPNQSAEIQNKFHMVCKTIRRKIRGEANDALVASNVGINWSVIKKTLITYYGEKRDLETLDYQLMTVQQKGRSLETYYDAVNRLLSLIANQIKTDDRFVHPEASKALIETYNKKAIDAFIRGLDGDIYRFIRNYEPTSLAGAYSYCIEFQNVECRKMLTRPKTYESTAAPRNLIPLAPPKLPPRNIQPNPQRNNNFKQQPVHRQNNFRPQQQFSNYKPNQQSFQQQPRVPPRKPFQPPPEPMDVDPSIRTNQVNYSNRPQHSSQMNPNKRPRLFNIANQQYEAPSNDLETDAGADYYPTEEENYYSKEDYDFERYLKQVETQENEAPEEDAENAELNFLG